MTRILAGVFAICAVACAFDTSGQPSAAGTPDAQESVSGAPDAAPTSIDAAPATIDAAPAPPDACVGKRCDEGGGGPGGG
jgi:hypothetical protein